jgi:hypothetical protein
MKIPEAIKEWELIILNLDGNKVASLSLDEEELYCVLILCLKSGYLPPLVRMFGLLHTIMW